MLESVNCGTRTRLSSLVRPPEAPSASWPKTTASSCSARTTATCALAPWAVQCHSLLCVAQRVAPAAGPTTRRDSSPAGLPSSNAELRGEWARVLLHARGAGANPQILSFSLTSRRSILHCALAHRGAPVTFLANERGLPDDPVFFSDVVRSRQPLVLSLLECHNHRRHMCFPITAPSCT